MSASQFMILRGSDYEIGRQHAEQMCVGFSESMAGFYSDLWSYMCRVPFRNPVERWGLAVLNHSLFPALRNRLVRSIPQSARERLRGFSDVTKVSADILETALVLPDLLPVLQSLAVRLQPSHFSPVVEVPTLGCSSLVSLGNALLHGRNLDFPGMGFWDRSPVVQVTEVPGKQRVISFSTAGVPVGGISAVNEAQISICLHQHYSRRFSTGGKPPFVIAEEALQTFSRFEEVVDYIARSRISSAWAFVICDGKTGRSAVVERDVQGAGLRHYAQKDAHYSHSNYFQTAECRSHEYSVSEKMTWDNFARRSRLESLAREAGPALGPEQIAAALSDHWDPYWGEAKVVNRTVSQAFNIQSIVLDVSAMKVWIAEGETPVHLGAFVQYDLGTLLAGKVPSPQVRMQACTLKQHPKLASAKQNLVAAFVQAFARKFGPSRELLEKVVIEAPCLETYLALTAMRLKAGDYEAGQASIEDGIAWAEDKAKALGKSQMPPEYFEARLKSAHCADLLGKRNLAVQRYRALANEKGLRDSRVLREAQRAKRYTAHRLDKLLVPFSTYFPSD